MVCRPFGAGTRVLIYCDFGSVHDSCMMSVIVLTISDLEVLLNCSMVTNLELIPLKIPLQPVIIGKQLRN
jgi:hypothetical protein